MLIKNTKYLFPLKNLWKQCGKLHYLFVFAAFSTKIDTWVFSAAVKLRHVQQWERVGKTMIPKQEGWLGSPAGSCRVRQHPGSNSGCQSWGRINDWQSSFGDKNLQNLRRSSKLFFSLGTTSKDCAHNCLWFQRASETQDMFGCSGFLFVREGFACSYQGFLGPLRNSAVPVHILGKWRRPQGAVSTVSNLRWQCGETLGRDRALVSGVRWASSYLLEFLPGWWAKRVLACDTFAVGNCCVTKTHIFSVHIATSIWLARTSVGDLGVADLGWACFCFFKSAGLDWPWLDLTG